MRMNRLRCICQYWRGSGDAGGGGPGGLTDAGGAVRLPASLAEASVAFAASSLLHLAFGEDLHASLLDSQARGGCLVAADWRAWLI